MPAAVRSGIAFALTAVIAWADFTTPPYIFLIGFYLFPIYLAVWYCGRTISGLLIALSLGTSLYMTALNIPPQEPPWHVALAYLSVILVYLGFSLLMFNLKASFKRLLDENQTDSLTGLSSRRNFVELAQFEIARANRSHEPMTLAVVDLDNFKYVNDTQGHAAGDALLVAASRCMKSTLREVDLIGRLGGDEFAILLPGTATDQGTLVLQRLHSNLRALLQTFSHRTTASIGAVEIAPGIALSLADLLKKADAQMYSVKMASKDGVSVASVAE
jgi:diguanylate cyclase (GGDEF)-like protein